VKSSLGFEVFFLSKNILFKMEEEFDNVIWGKFPKKQKTM
jgi:hypothetical protein